ncbi:MAG: hypothetical protein KF723_02505 [Rhizobiaceae bacterium]|nr:hypothetical protein [Rhizobiaceae bacterium]
MPHPFDPAGLAKDIAAAVSGTLQQDVTAMSGFSRTQLQAMSKQAAWIAEAAANNEITKAQRDFFLQDLARMALTFVKVIKGLSLIAVEKAWNAAVRVIWGAIETVIGKALPLPF